MVDERSRGVIGRAFRRSLWVIGGLLAAGLGLWWWGSHGPGPAPVSQAPLRAPAPVAAPAVALPSIPFRDITRQAGIDFVHSNGAAGEHLLPETMGSGAAFLDFDGDGDQDLLLVNSRPWPWTSADQTGTQVATQALYRNDGQGHFEDVTAGSGLDLSLYGMGVAVGDYDADGREDVYLTALGGNRLLHNEGQGHFRDVTEPAGVAGPEDSWSTSAAFFDADGDGDLDLFVADYVAWSRTLDLQVDFQLTGVGRAYGPPTAFPGSYDRLFRNTGHGRFQDVSAEAGIQVDNPATGEPMGKGLAVLPMDLDGDGALDLMVANDTVRNFLFHNRGGGRFQEQGVEAGVAFDRNGKATGAMGLDGAWFRNDRDLGIAVGNFANEMSALYVTQDGALPMADEAIVEGIGPASRLALSFGLFFFDADLDGRQDLLQANGHLESAIHKVQSSQHYRQSAQLFWNCGAGCASGFVVLEGGQVGDLVRPMVGRGATYADIDGDGDLDVLLTQNGGRPRLLRNEQALGHHWLRLRLQQAGANPGAIGAQVSLRSGGVTQRRVVMPTRSYLSQVELPVTFGLGDRTVVDELHIRWPDGHEQEVPVPGVDRLLKVEKK